MNLHRPLLLLTTAMLLICSIGHAQDTSIKPVFGITADAGFAVGPAISRTRLAGPIDGHVKAVFSVKQYQLYEAGIDVPEISRWMSFSLSSRYRNYPQEDFWGLGPNTPESARANYLMEDLDTTATVAATFHKLRAGLSGGYLKINTGPGRDTRYPIVPEAYELQPSFGHVGGFVEYNSLDEQSDPHKGGSYSFQWTAYLGTFQNYDVDLRYFIPVTASDRIGLRMESWFTHSSPDEHIPFFMLPFVGGSESVRGFPQYRFRDRNALLLNSEYRHSLNGFLDVVGFVDAGRVFHIAENFGLRYLHPGYGVGARVKFGSRMFFGIDVGFSSEGGKVYFRSDQMF